MPVITLTRTFIDSLRFSNYLVDGRLTIWSGGVPTQYTVPLSTVNVTVTRNQAQRRKCAVTAIVLPTIPPQPIMPTSPKSPLTPFGNEVFIETGILTAGGPQTWVPLGLFSISTVTVQDNTNDLSITITGYDRSWVVSQRKFKQQYTVPAVTGNFVAEVTHLLNQVWGDSPPLQFNIAPTTAKVPTATFNQGTSPWTAVLQMAAAVGYEVFFNVTGVVTGYPIPTPQKQPVVWNYTDTEDATFGVGGTSGSTELYGSPYSTPASSTSQFTRTGVFNDVIVTGTGHYTPTATDETTTTPPVLGEAMDTTPNSSTDVNGPMGDVPEFIQSNLVLTDEQAVAAAQNYLQAALSDAWQVSIDIPPNPALDIDDVVVITRPRIGLTEVKVVIDTITHTVSYATLTTITGRVVP